MMIEVDPAVLVSVFVLSLNLDVVLEGLCDCKREQSIC